MEEKKTAVKFGTDGWRAIIADDFTYENVRLAAAAIANYVLAHEDAKQGVCIGWDTRFGSRSFAQVAAEVVASAGIPVALSGVVTPTPALSFAVRERKAAGGIVITSSHNPAEWNGVKYKGSYGGSGTPAIMTSIESYLGKPLAKADVPATIEEVDFIPGYVAALEKLVDLDAIKRSGYKFLIDVMYGAGRGVIAGIFKKAGIPFVEMRGEINPAFPGINPEPILPHIRATQQAVVAEKCDAAFVTDGDADRIGGVDE
ncbi:MAG: phosphoglucomutase/phosphomannomutase family protein, partial [Acidobacteriaceae bacterium]|nr:phosphoglucomutase/phosphomannomutase family protein [Acidobacteriaceae bacterium]